jgi:hypothetical protein
MPFIEAFGATIPARCLFQTTFNDLLCFMIWNEVGGNRPGVDIKGQSHRYRMSERHTSILTTLNLYAQAVSEAKREAASKLVGVLWKH